MRAAAGCGFIVILRNEFRNGLGEFVTESRPLGGATPLGRCRTNDTRPATGARERHAIASDGLVDQARDLRTSKCGRARQVIIERVWLADPCNSFSGSGNSSP